MQPANTTRGEYIYRNFGYYFCSKTGEFAKKKIYPLEKELEVLYSGLDLYPKSLQTIIEETKMSPEIVVRGLMELELMKLVYEPVKNYYSLRG
jgi:predicted Rossmann fold nucleotide-binding protein DprA/Smf involved in DNA uptake